LFRAEKEKDIDIWMDALYFYREVGWEPPGGVPDGEGGAPATTTNGAGGAN
jgi:hypothetical protein